MTRSTVSQTCLAPVRRAAEAAPAVGFMAVWGVLLGSLLLSTGCAGLGGRSGTEFLDRADHRGVWPEPPAPPRLAYLLSIRTPADLHLRTSGWKKFTGWLTGNQVGRGGFVKPFAVAVDAGNNLCVTDTGLGALWFFDLTHRKFQVWFQVGPYRLTQPVGVARRDGRFYLADSALDRVLIFDHPKHLRHEIAFPEGRPAGLAVTADRIYVSDSEQHRIGVFDHEGRLEHWFGRRGVGPGEFNAPTHLSVDAAGRLYVTDALNARVQVFDPAGECLAVFGKPGDTSGHFGRPKGAAADSFGHVYVTDAMFDNFQVFDLEGRFLLHVGEAGGEPGQFWLPAGVAVDGKDRIFVADSYNRRVQVFEYLPPGDGGEAP